MFLWFPTANNESVLMLQTLVEKFYGIFPKHCFPLQKTRLSSITNLWVNVNVWPCLFKWSSFTKNFSQYIWRYLVNKSYEYLRLMTNDSNSTRWLLRWTIALCLHIFCFKILYLVFWNAMRKTIFWRTKLL